MISTKGRYALRVMIDLAECEKDAIDADNTLPCGTDSGAGKKAPGGNGPAQYIALKDIAERQGISKKYLEIIVKDLVSAGLIMGTRGKSGGYKLTRVPDDYTVQEILDATEGPLAAVACLMKDAEACPRSSFCKTLPLWKEYDELTRDFFSRKKLSDLV